MTRYQNLCFIVGIVTFVICFTLPFVFIAGFLVMKVMRTKGKVKQMTKVTIPTTKRGSDTVVPVEPGLLIVAKKLGWELNE
jgi:hypothetical protein